jgi:cyanophycinase-like exopeptidase
VADPDPTSADIEAQAMASFRTNYNRIEPGLGLIGNADFEPALTGDYRWGRLYALARTDPQSIVFGVCGSTAIVLDLSGPTVAGTESVVSVDARTARFLNGENGALTALDVLMDFFAPGETLEG